jgi:Arc/MetJ family transcription regulator
MSLMTVEPDADKPDAEPEIDEELIAEAQAGLGTSSRNETINVLAREYVMAKRKIRREAHEAILRMADEGLLDFSKAEELDR